MKIFISWSGEKAKAGAEALRGWLPDVIQDVQPWMSASDIEAGARWNRRVDEHLSESRFGVVCLTRANQTAPWILFETGALAKTIEDTFVCPYLLDLDASGIQQGPLTQFQAKRATENDTLELVRSINRAMKEHALPDDKLKRTFDRWWPDLEVKLARLPDEPAPRRRSSEDMIEEILMSVRDIKRIADAQAPSFDDVILAHANQAPNAAQLQRAYLNSRSSSRALDLAFERIREERGERARERQEARPDVAAKKSDA